MKHLTSKKRITLDVIFTNFRSIAFIDFNVKSSERTLDQVVLEFSRPMLQLPARQTRLGLSPLFHILVNVRHKKVQKKSKTFHFIFRVSLCEPSNSRS